MIVMVAIAMAERGENGKIMVSISVAFQQRLGQCIWGEGVSDRARDASQRLTEKEAFEFDRLSGVGGLGVDLDGISEDVEGEMGAQQDEDAQGDDL